MEQKNKQIYSSYGNFIREEIVGYELTQFVQIESRDVAKMGVFQITG
jgi:hypothetical protein